MKMVFNSGEVTQILREHVQRAFGLSNEEVKGVTWKATKSSVDRKDFDVLEMEVHVMSMKKEPYR